jgi:hypothetical protein
MISFAKTFVKHDLNGVLKRIRVEIGIQSPSPQAMTIIDSITDHYRRIQNPSLYKNYY